MLLNAKASDNLSKKANRYFPSLHIHSCDVAGQSGPLLCRYSLESFELYITEPEDTPMLCGWAE